MSDVVTIPELVDEREAYRRYGHILEDGELEKSREEQAIAFFDAKTVLYKPTDLRNYIIGKLSAKFEGLANPYGESVVYFISIAGSETAPVKIGIAANLEKRLGALQVSHYETLTVLAFVPGDRDRECEIHQRVKGRIRGEWFKRTPGLVEVMEELVSAERDRRDARWALSEQIDKIHAELAG